MYQAWMYVSIDYLDYVAMCPRRVCVYILHGCNCTQNMINELVMGISSTV